MRTLPLTYKTKQATKGLHGNVYKFPKKDAVLNQFGFNGQLKDNEIYGEGNAYAFEYRIQDPRLVRFLSVDPLKKDYPWYSPYQFAGNSPILFIDLDGLERALPKQNTKKSAVVIYTEKHGPVSIYSPATSYQVTKNKKFKKAKQDDKTGWGYTETHKPATNQNIPFFTGQATEEIDLSNPLDRSENFQFQRIDLVPTYKKGNIKADFTISEGEEGTVELGIVTQDGSESILISAPAQKSGSINADFELKDGEELYFRLNNARGNTHIGATKVENDKSDE